METQIDIPSFGPPPIPPSCIRPDPGRGGGTGFVSFGSFCFGGFGDAVAEEVAVLPLPKAFLRAIGPDEFLRSVSLFLGSTKGGACG